LEAKFWLEMHSYRVTSFAYELFDVVISTYMSYKLPKLQECQVTVKDSLYLSSGPDLCASLLRCRLGGAARTSMQMRVITDLLKLH